METTVAHAYGIICAKTEELSAVRDVLNDRFPVKARNWRRDFPVHVVRGFEDGPPTTVFAATCGHMGNVHAASKTAQIVTRYAPSVLLFVGTAASLDPQTLRVGDVVLPQASAYRLYDKIVQKGNASYRAVEKNSDFKEFFFEETALLADLKKVELSESALAVLSGYTPSAGLEDGVLANEWLSQINRKPKVELDSEIFTCGMVVDSDRYKNFIMSYVPRKASAIDMESYGFFQSLKLLQENGHGVAGLMVRGISDYGGRKAEMELRVEGGSDWKAIAMKNAAFVACDLIRQDEEMNRGREHG